MERNAAPDLFGTDAGSGLEPPRFFAPRNYVQCDAATLKHAALLRDLLAPKEKPSAVDAPKPPRSLEARRETKIRLVKFLRRLTDAAPLDEDTKQPLKAAYDAFIAARTNDEARESLGKFEGLLASARDSLSPPVMHVDPRSFVGLHSQNTILHLRHMREVISALDQERREGLREVTTKTTPTLINVEMLTRLTLEMDTLSRSLALGIKTHSLGSVSEKCALQEAAMDGIHGRWRDIKLNVPQDWPTKVDKSSARSGKTTMSLGELFDSMKAAETLEEFQPYQQLLQYIVAKRAYYFTRNLASAYEHDEAHLTKQIAARNRQRYEQPAGENLFDGHHELISAGYNASWVVNVRTALSLMVNKETLLADTTIPALEGVHASRATRVVRANQR